MDNKKMYTLTIINYNSSCADGERYQLNMAAETAEIIEKFLNFLNNETTSDIPTIALEENSSSKVFTI